MSSLLDVLHKRPPRSQTAAAETVVTARPTTPEPGESEPGTGGPESGAASRAVDILLAPDLELAPGTMTLRHASLAYGDELTMRVRQPDPPAAEATRRWSDPSAATQALPPTLNRTAARRSRLPVVLAALALVLAACGYLAWQFMGTAGDSFIADGADRKLAGPAAMAASVNSHPVAQPAPVAPATATAAGASGPENSAQGIEAANAADVDTPAAKGDVAWYDQPALPAAADARTTPSIQIVRGSVENPVFPRLRAAYDALRVGDAAKSESLYREVLAADPNNVDAQLGLGSLATSGGRFDEARDAYRRALLLDPKNASAVAALSALPGAGSQANEESRLKSMLREQPASAELNFALGLRYVADQRWSDAQSAFFEAVRNDPTNADYAFNLAVSLDSLGQAPLAATYYERAIGLASGSHQFDVEIARARLATLRGAPG